MGQGCEEGRVAGERDRGGDFDFDLDLDIDLDCEGERDEDGEREAERDCDRERERDGEVDGDRDRDLDGDRLRFPLCLDLFAKNELELLLSSSLRREEERWDDDDDDAAEEELDVSRRFFCFLSFSFFSHSSSAIHRSLGVPYFFHSRSFSSRCRLCSLPKSLSLKPLRSCWYTCSCKSFPSWLSLR